MKAAVMRAFNAPLEIEDVEIDAPGPGEVLVKTAATGICHSDLHVIEGSLPMPPPCVLGHEPAGIVEAVGEGVIDVRPGDHVIGCLTTFCGVCRFCTEGRPYLCLPQYAGRPAGAKSRLTARNGDPISQLANLGAFAEKILWPERSLVKIRDDMPLDRASLIGCGGVGLAAIQGVRIVGAGKVIAVDTQPWKLELSRKLGATDCLSVKDGDPVAAVHAITGGGADYALECIGLSSAVQQAVAMTGRGGTTLLVGVVPMTETVPTATCDLTLQEKKIGGSYMGSNRFRFDMPKYVDFYLDGRLWLDEMISARIALDDVNGAFDRMRKGEAVREVIVFS